MALDRSEMNSAKFNETRTRIVALVEAMPATSSAPTATPLAIHRTHLVAIIVIVLLACMPLAIWMDLKNISDSALRMQSQEVAKVIDGVRSLYAREVVARVQDKTATGKTVVVHNYKDMVGAIPIPATFSIELAQQITSNKANVAYRFVSDYPFNNRGDHHLDEFEKDALATLRANPEAKVDELTGSMFDRRIRIATPVLMAQTCVNCHNSHAESPKTDWKVGDVRGIQTITAELPVFRNIFAPKWLLGYMLLVAFFGFAFTALQKKQSAAIAKINGNLTKSNDFLAAISVKLSKYLSPQVYKSIFSGERDVVVSTERKKLTIFFSDIKDFTETTERLQPEEITSMLNEYFTEMSAIALKHGATIDKFIGDAILVFFGDPETKGVKEDALACVRMAMEMQVRLLQMSADLRNRGIERPFQVRMGINTGYCNVGNFGSNDRMDYTIIGGEANLAARLQTSAEPGQIVMSYETYALVSDHIRAHPIAPMKVKGITREIVPYVVDSLVEGSGRPQSVICELGKGLSLVVNLDGMDQQAMKHAQQRLHAAYLAIKERREARG